jgi:hypothetical protein
MPPFRAVSYGVGRNRPVSIPRAAARRSLNIRFLQRVEPPRRAASCVVRGPIASERMRIVLCDVKSREGFVSKDTVAGGYGSRLRPFSRVTGVISWWKSRFHDLPSVQLAYLAAIVDRAGHEVVMSHGDVVDGDVAIVLSSLVDHRAEAAWMSAMRARGARTGVVGLTASKLPELFDAAADFVIQGEPEAAMFRIVAGEPLAGRVDSPEISDLDGLPYPRWDLISPRRRRVHVPFAGRVGGAFPLLASRGCPEFCTYCPASDPDGTSHAIGRQHSRRAC